jgi:glutamate--cysteine ligase catalytic subunit
MALLVEGEALSPEETKEFLNFIRNHGITQFLNIWRRVKDLQGDELKFGDEVECGVFVVDDEKKTVKLSIRGAEVIFKSDIAERILICLSTTAAFSTKGEGSTVFS